MPPLWGLTGGRESIGSGGASTHGRLIIWRTFGSKKEFYCFNQRGHSPPYMVVLVFWI